MEERVIEKKPDQPTVRKKVYTPPALIKYGKLTDLTAGGTGKHKETHPQGPGARP